MVWITMSLAPHVGSKKRKKTESKPHSQINKCLNEKRRREQENIHIEELAELVSASPSDMSSLSCKPDKCAILKETVNQIRSQKQSKSDICDDLQQSEVSSSKPNIINNHIFGSILLEALEGFLFVVNIDGKVEFVSENITSFLKYNQDEVYEKNIYDFIHPNDRARFNSNLLLMMPLGNGHDWSSESSFNSPGKLTKHFNCHFLVKSEESEISMENKQSCIPQYENLNITANYIPLGEDGNNDVRNGLTCIARRVALEEKHIGVNKVEQFTTRIDRDGKVVDIDTSMLSPSSSQYLRKELLGSPMLDFCHPSDLPTFKQHLKETFETGAATCVPFKFRVVHDRYARIKTKSRRFHTVQSVEEFIVSTHSIIRECDSSSTTESQKNIPSPSSLASSSSGPGSVSDSSTSINGSIALSPLTASNSYGNYSTSLSAHNSSEFGLSDLVLDMFPSSSWNLDPSSAQSKESDCTSATSFISSPQAAPSSNRSSETSAAASPVNSAFVPGLTSNRSGSSIPSPAVQGRAPTPCGGSCYSPSTSQSSSGRSSPPRALPAKSDPLNGSSTEISGIILNPGIRQDRQLDLKSNQKLRNLLMQNIDDSAMRQNSRQSSQENVTVLSETQTFVEDSSHLSHVNVREGQNVPRTSSNVILRDLLNQEDDSDAPVEPIEKSMESSVPNPLLNAASCKATEGGARHRLGNNNMLRKLLNNDDADRTYRKSQDLIHQLLMANSSSKSSPVQNDKLRQDNLPSPRLPENCVPKQVSAESSRGTPDVTFLSETTLKRKAVDKNPPSTSAKKPNVGRHHAHLAGQNPMLASMLAQTPRTPPTVPTSVASTIMTQLPQERLPKNLEKKLVHTPYTTIATSGIPTSSQAFSLQLATTPLQRDIVTSDSRGHVMQQHPQVSNASGLKAYTQQQQGFLDKILTGNDDNILIAKSLALGVSNIGASVQNLSTFAQLSQPVPETSSSVILADILNDAALADVDSLSDTVQTNQTSDPNFAEILEQIYSLQEDHNVETPKGADDRTAILKLLGDVIDTPVASVPSRPASVSTDQDLSEKIAICAIQKELMEGSSAAIANRTISLQNAATVPTYSQAGRSGTQVSGTPTVQTQFTPEQIIFLQQQQQLVTGSLPPNYNLVASRVRLPVATQANLINNSEPLSHSQRLQLIRSTYVGLHSASLNQIRKNMKQRLYLQQQQKRLLEQQQKQQLTMQTQQPMDAVNSPGANAFPENMNDLLNNTVAPNVTLLRSSGIPEVPGSSRFNLTLANPLPSPTHQTSPSPSQLSPGQRCNPRSPFSPLSQQPFPSQTPPPTSYQQSRLSPHPPPSYPQGGTSHSSSPVPSTVSHMVLSPQPSSVSPQWSQHITTSPVQNLQLQNPMLNAQLSQASIGTNQIRLTAQQRQQLALRSLSSPTTVQNARSNAFSSQSEGSYSPLSPVMILQSQSAQQQRIQRTVSGPARISSGAQNQSNFSSSEPALSPQSLSSPSFTQSVSTTPTTAYVSIASPGGPVTYSISQGGQHFTFDRRNLQVFTSSANESLRSSPNVQSSDVVRQELRSVVNSRDQPNSSGTNQQVLHSLPSGSVTRVLNIHSLTRETLEELGLSVELLPGQDAQTTSQALYSQALLSVASNLENSSHPIVTSPRVQVEEPKPTDQKKSLLQQLLSEPT